VDGAREISLEELFAATSDPFIRHQVDPAAAKHAWVHGDAVVVSGGRGRPGEVPVGPVYTCIGPVSELAPLMREVAAVAEPAWRVTNVSASDPHVPPTWHRPGPHRWHWMLTATPPGESDGIEVTDITDADEINRVLDRANADSHARPGAAGVETWLGARRQGALLGVGALMRLPDGTGHLRAVGVLPEARGLGLGTAISVALTRRGFANGSTVCTLGVYTDNAVAIAMYRRIGYHFVHTFTSGAVGRA
jgi:ribosomal protein S18 acetylase RimI-like enzyme